MLKFVPGTNQYYAMWIKSLVQGNNVSLSLGIKLTTDRHPQIMNRTHYPLWHITPLQIKNCPIELLFNFSLTILEQKTTQFYNIFFN